MSVPYVIGIGVLDAFLVDDHVAGNREGHPECERDVAPLSFATNATDDKDTDSHQGDSSDLQH